jgi:hypothetical protein
MGEAGWMLEAGSFTALDTADRQAVSDWLDYASGIDSVIDLAARPWNIPGASGILGVFEACRNQATWLIVRDTSGWVLAHCQDGFVSDVFDSMPEILRLIDDQRQTATPPQ